jgi:hypothetical protein
MLVYQRVKSYHLHPTIMPLHINPNMFLQDSNISMPRLTRPEPEMLSSVVSGDFYEQLPFPNFPPGIMWSNSGSSVTGSGRWWEMKLAEISKRLKQSILKITNPRPGHTWPWIFHILTQATTGRWNVPQWAQGGLVNPPTEHDACHGKGEENPGRRAVACRREWRNEARSKNDRSAFLNCRWSLIEFLWCIKRSNSIMSNHPDIADVHITIHATACCSLP